MKPSKIKQVVDPIITEAIQREVQKEDLIIWAKKPVVYSEEIMHKQLPSQRWNPTNNYLMRFLSL